MTTPLQYVQLLARNIIVLFKQVFLPRKFLYVAKIFEYL